MEEKINYKGDHIMGKYLTVLVVLIISAVSVDVVQGYDVVKVTDGTTLKGTVSF